MSHVEVAKVLFVLVASLACSVPQAIESRHDGSWWETLTVGDRTAYAAGFMDCAIFDANMPRAADANWEELQAQTSAHYAKRPTERRTPVASVMAQIVRPRRPPSSPGGEEYPGKHGIFDGNYWRMMTPEEQLGFLKGYTECLRTQKVKAPKFSKPATWYRSRISEWFGTTAEDQGTIRGDREDQKIADVLWRLGD